CADCTPGLRPGVCASAPQADLEAGSHTVPSIRTGACGACPSAPDLAGNVNDHAELCPLLGFGENVALLGAGKAALRAEAELLDRCEPGGFIDPPLDIVLALQAAALGGDQAHHYAFVALGQEAQRFQATGAVGVILEKVPIISDTAEEQVGHGLIAALG